MSRRLVLVLALVLAGGLLAAALPPAPATALVKFDFEQKYFVHPGRQVWDFCVVRIDSLYNIFYHSILEAKPGAAEADTIWRATSPDLMHWQIRGPVLLAGPTWYDGEAVWAPDVVWDGAGHRWVMIYTGVDSLMNQRACAAYSFDLDHWLKSPRNPVFTPDTLTYFWSPTGTWSSFRDPFIFRQDGLWHMLSTAALREEGYPGTRRGIIHHATSTALVDWIDAGPFFVHDGAQPEHDLESSQYLVRGSYHHLFFSEVNVPGTSHLVATDPDSFTMADWQLLERGGAPEIDQFDPDIDIFSRYALSLNPQNQHLMYVVRFDTLRFMAQGELPIIYKPHPLNAQWPLRLGSANLANPTFGDNTAMRGSEPCGLVGNSWYGSAEYYQGPLSGLGSPGSYLGDAATGTLISRPFVITGDLIRLRVGGGHYPTTCYVALIEETSGHVLRSETGEQRERMTERVWDVRPYRGMRVQIKILDQETGPWGHINVDEIEEVLDPLSDVEPVPSARLVSCAAVPNPGNPAVQIRYELSAPALARVCVHDLRGRLVWCSPQVRQEAGAQAFRWDGRGDDGRAVAAGIYLYAIELDGAPAATGKLSLIK